MKIIDINNETKLAKKFIPYWFVWNGWGNVRGREAKSCSHCFHRLDVCCSGDCELFCSKNNIKINGDLVCNEFEWDPEYKSIFDDERYTYHCEEILLDLKNSLPKECFDALLKPYLEELKK